MPGGGRGSARRSRPRPARRAAPSARRAAPRRRPAAPRTAPGPARPAATARRRGRCRPRTPSRASCRGRRGRRRRPPPSAARIDVVGGAGRARRCRAAALEADEVLEHRGDPGPPGVDVELAQVDAVDLDRARLAGRRGGRAAWPAWSCRRRSARRWRATSRPGCEVEVLAAPAAPVASGSRSVTSRNRISRAGLPVGGRSPGRQRAGRRQPSAEPQHRGDRRRGPVERPVEPAERDHRRADRGLGVGDDLAELDPAGRRPRGQRPEHAARSPPTTSTTQPSTDRSRSRVASYCSWCSRCGALDEAVEHPVGEAEQPELLGGRRVDREPVGVLGVPLRRPHLARCCGPARPRSRAAASAWPARRRRARAAPTRRTRTAPRRRPARRASRPARRR